MMFDFNDRSKRNVIALSILILFMLILFGPLVTVKDNYDGGEDALSGSDVTSQTDINNKSIQNAGVEEIKITFTTKKPRKICSANAGNICFSKPFNPSPISKTECGNIKFKLGIKECGYDDDMWAGAVKKCGGVEHMASPEDLAYLAQALYILPDGSSPKINPEDFYSGDAKFNSKKAKEFGFSSSGYLALWSNKEVDGEIVSRPGEYAYGRNYFPTNSSWYPYERYGKNNKRMAVCVFKD